MRIGFPENTSPLIKTPVSTIEMSHWLRYTNTVGTATKGDWVVLMQNTPFDFYSIAIAISEIGLNTTNNNALIDIAIGEPGSEVIQIANLNGGNASSSVSGTNVFHLTYWFPLFIPRGSTISMRAQANTASDQLDIRMWGLFEPQFSPQPFGPWTTYGADTTNTRGTSVTAGNGAAGTWTEIATTSKAHALWIVGIDILTDTTQTASDHYLVQLGHGPDSSTVTILGHFHSYFNTSEGQIGGCIPWFCGGQVAASTKLWIRMTTSEASARGVIIYAF